MEIYILVRTVTYAQAVIRLLEREGFSCRQAKSPRQIGKGGCGYAVVVKNASAESVLRAIGGAALPSFKVYSTQNGVDFEKHR